MDLKEIKTTEPWVLYQRGVDFCRINNMFTDTDLNYRMYNGDQWEGLIVQNVEKIQLNFIKPIVRYKVGIILQNLYAINYSSENIESKEFRSKAEELCKLLNKRAAKIWEKDKMDVKLRQVVKDAAINDEGVFYITYDEENDCPINEVLDKTDIFFGNENSSDIQSQPYILIKQRMPVSEAQRIAEFYGADPTLIMGDLDTLEQAGDAAKLEENPQVTMITKFFKVKGEVWYSKATKFVDIEKNKNTQLKLYPLTHMLWEEKKGSARGEGEVRYLIPNQIEVNKTAMRRVVSAKNTAYPRMILNRDKVQNPDAASTVGGIIETYGMDVDDVSKVIASIPPATMSPDVKALQEELIQITRELAGAGDIATGQINPESASGRAILAVQHASQQPLTEHLEYAKNMIEDLARIWLDMTITYLNNLKLEEEVVDEETGAKTFKLIDVPEPTLKKLQTSAKIDITPKGPFDKYAQEMSLENLLQNGYFTPQRLPELKLYAEALDDDSVMPKAKLLKMIEKAEAEQMKIAQLDARAQIVQANANQFINEGPEAQAAQIVEAKAEQEALANLEEVEA